MGSIPIARFFYKENGKKLPMEIAILYSQKVKDYDFGEGHPFHGERGEKFLEFLKKNLKEKTPPILEAKKASDEDLALICKRDYIEFTKNFYQQKSKGKDFDGRFYQYHSPDNLPGKNPGEIEEAARYIIGQAKLAADLVQKNKFKRVISIGGGLHHAKESFGEGFCLYNDVAFCAKYLLKKYHLKRILILDTDAHAGNGTMEYFYEVPEVLFIDIHQDPRTLYPGTGFVEEIGKGPGQGFTVNIPLPPFAGDECYQMVFEEIVEPLVKEFQPEIVIRNGGSDPYFADPLTNLGLTLKGFYLIGEKVRKLAEKEIDLIASGYNLEALPYCWFSLISGLMGKRIQFKKGSEKQLEKEPIKETKEILKEIKEILHPYWKCF